MPDFLDLSNVPIGLGRLFPSMGTFVPECCILKSGSIDLQLAVTLSNFQTLNAKQFSRSLLVLTTESLCVCFDRSHQSSYVPAYSRIQEWHCCPHSPGEYSHHPLCIDCRELPCPDRSWSVLICDRVALWIKPYINYIRKRWKGMEVRNSDEDFFVTSHTSTPPQTCARV